MWSLRLRLDRSQIERHEEWGVMAKSEHVNGDGSRFVARSTDGIMGTLVTVSHSSIRTAGGQLLWDGPAYGTRMYYMPGGGQMVPISHPRYERAESKAAAVRLALAFFAESYADTLAHAEAEGIPVADCFASE